MIRSARCATAAQEALSEGSSAPPGDQEHAGLDHLPQRIGLAHHEGAGRNRLHQGGGARREVLRAHAQPEHAGRAGPQEA